MATVKGFWIGSSTAVGAVHTFSVYPNHAEITAETAIALLADKDKSFWVETGISGIVSDGKEETFEQPVPMIHRKNVTRITFRAAATGLTVLRARYMILYWS